MSFVERSTAYFQPIVDLNSSQVIGAETLVRFVEPDGTLRGPGGIIEQIEESLGDLEALTWRLFCDIAAKAGPLLDRQRSFYISVNVPPILLGSPRLKQILEDSGLARYIDRLVCEITERQALTDAGREALAITKPTPRMIARYSNPLPKKGLETLPPVKEDPHHGTALFRASVESVGTPRDWQAAQAAARSRGVSAGAGGSLLVAGIDGRADRRHRRPRPFDGCAFGSHTP